MRCKAMSADLATSCQDLTAHPVLDAVEDYRDTLDSFLQVWQAAAAWQAVCSMLRAACFERSRHLSLAPDTKSCVPQSNCRRWLEALLGTALPPGAPLAELLRSGRLL